MADWLAPFKLPKFTDQAFEDAKDAYNAKNGYTITIPALDDIITIKPFPPMSAKETAAWRAKKYNEFLPERLEEIRTEKAKRKQKMMNMLASPSPKWLRSVGSVMTSLDNAQDALATLATVGLIAARVIGGVTSATLAGPLGWIIGATTLLNLLNPQTWIKIPKLSRPKGRVAKRQLLDMTDKNPFSKQARMKSTANIKNFRPGISNLIEGLQTTQNIFGFGITLGPIMGLAQDIISGAARYAMGEPVSVKFSSPKMPKHTQTAQDVMTSNALLHGFQWQSDVEDEQYSLISGNLAMQVLDPYIQEWNPFNQVNNLRGVMIPAPRPKSVLVEEILIEEGFSIEGACNWPQTEQNYITLDDLMDSTRERATANFEHFADVNRHDVKSFIAAQNMHDFSLGLMESIEGRGQVQVEYSITERIVYIILDNGWKMPDNLTDTQILKFEEWVSFCERTKKMPTGSEIYSVASWFCGFQWETDL